MHLSGDYKLLQRNLFRLEMHNIIPLISDPHHLVIESLDHLYLRTQKRIAKPLDPL